MAQEIVRYLILEGEGGRVVQGAWTYKNAIELFSKHRRFDIRNGKGNAESLIQDFGGTYTGFWYVNAVDPHALLAEQVGKETLTTPNI